MDSDEDSLPIFKSEYTKGILVDSAPEVSIDSLQNSELQKRDLALKGIYNFERSKKNHLTGNVQETSIDSFLFEEQRNTFDVHGITSDPSHPDLTVVIRNTERLGQWHGAQGEAIVMPKEAFAEGRLLKKTTMGPLNKEEQQRTKLLREKRVKKDDPGSSDYLGPWAGYEFEKVFDTELDEEEKLDILKKMEENRKKKVEAIVYEKEVCSNLRLIYEGLSRNSCQAVSFLETTQRTTEVNRGLRLQPDSKSETTRATFRKKWFIITLATRRECKL